jgi:alpha-D-xyloside xylohydrolase
MLDPDEAIYGLGQFLFVKSILVSPVTEPMYTMKDDEYEPLEIRFYPCADGEFLLYEDERDNYNYEKGLYLTIAFKWDDEEEILKIGERKGMYPGMVKQIQFNIVLVGPGQGSGVKPAERINRII